jgi:hypothetical protein
VQNFIKSKTNFAKTNFAKTVFGVERNLYLFQKLEVIFFPSIIRQKISSSFYSSYRDLLTKSIIYQFICTQDTAINTSCRACRCELQATEVALNGPIEMKAAFLLAWHKLFVWL